MKINAKSWLFVGVASLAVAGCSGTVDGGGSAGSGATGGSGTGGSGTGGIGAGGTAGAGGSGAGTPCGGKPPAACPANEYCDFPDDICSTADGNGVCRSRPQACPDIYMPVCACDLMVYGNECEAAAAGVDVFNTGSCMPPQANLFNCGHGFCDSATQYCNKTNTDVGGTADSYGCAPLPAACAGMPASCTCIGAPCGSPIPGMCAASGTGFIVTCPGG